MKAVKKPQQKRIGAIKKTSKLNVLKLNQLPKTVLFQIMEKLKPTDQQNLRQTCNSLKETVEDLKRHKFLKWLNENRGNQIANTLEFVFSFYFELGIYSPDLEEFTRRPEIFTNLIERRNVLKTVFKSIGENLTAYQKKILYLATLMRIVKELSLKRKVFQKRRVASFHVQKFSFNLTNFWLGILWSERQSNSFDFDQDGYDLLIIFIEFMLVKQSNFKDSISTVLLKYRPIMYRDKVIMCGAKSFLSKNRRVPKMEVTFEYRGSATLIKKIRDNWETPLELLNLPDEDFRTFIRIKTPESKHWGCAGDYYYNL